MQHVDQLSDYKLLKEDMLLTGILQERVVICFKVIYIVAEVNHRDLYRDSNCAPTERRSPVLPMRQQSRFHLDLSVTKAWLNDKQRTDKECGKKLPRYNLLYYCMEGLRKIMKNFSQDSLCPYWDSNRAEKKSQTLPLKSSCLPGEFLFRSHLLHTSAEYFNIHALEWIIPALWVHCAAGSRVGRARNINLSS